MECPQPRKGETAVETANRKIVRVGFVTLAFGLIALGSGILASNLGLMGVQRVLMLWPLLLIGLGLEYFIRKLRAGDKEVQFSVSCAVLIGLMAAIAAAANTLYGFAPGWLLSEDIFRSNTGYVRQWEGQPLDLDQGSRLEIENKVGDIEITASPDSKLHLSARITARGSNEESARAAAEAQRIIVETGRVTRVYTDSEWRTSVKLRLEVPAGLNIRASDRMGSILAQKVSAEALTAETSMGMIEVDDFTGFLKAENKMGEINLKNIKGDSRVDGSMGRITVIQPGGSVTVNNRFGSIELASAKPLEKNYVLKGDNGEITLRLPRSSNLRIQASSDNGSITGLENYRYSKGNNTRGELTLGGGTGSALLETRNGAIRVEVTD